MSFRWPMPPDTVVTQEIADAQIGLTLYSGGIAGTAKGTVVAATAAEDGRSIELTVNLEDM